MTSRRSFCVLCAVLAFAPIGRAAPASQAAGRSRVVAYVPNWIDLKIFTPTIDFAKLTHVNIAFENPTNDAGDLSFNPQNKFLIDAARAAGVKALLSIGGGSAAGDKALLKRYDMLLSPGRRAEFVAKLAGYLQKHQFDGLDVDIEGPAIGKDYGAFIEDLAKSLKPKMLLTAALSKGYGGNHVPDAALKLFDFVNVMAYDGSGPWNPKAPGPHSSMEFAKDNVEYWLKRGLARDRCVLGVPFYGYGFGPAFKKGDYPYAKIVAQFPGAENADQAGDTVYYNGLPAIRGKSKYVIDQQLGGVMIWSLDNDARGEKSLLQAIDQTLRPPAKPGAP